MHVLKRWIAWTAVLATGLMIGGCSAMVETNTDFSPDYHYRDLKTFMWSPDLKRPAEHPQVVSKVIDTEIRRAVETTLAQRGFKQVDAPPADMHLYYGATVTREMTGNSMCDHYGYAPLPEIPDKTYPRGTMIVDIVDPATRALIWRGTGAANYAAARSEREMLIKIAARDLLTRFPPKTGAE